MRRKADSYLLEWFFDPHRKPMMMRGARQVGKTWLVRNLAKAANKTLIEINFEKNPEFHPLFHSNEPEKIIRNIELAMDIRIDIHNTLLFLDEIQVVPELLAKLRWFYESLPLLPVIAAGSLLDFALAEHTFSMPVGRITYMHIEPLSFEEFLWAKNSNQLVHFLQTVSTQENIVEPIHTKLMRLFQEYVIIGGMPQAVSTWIESNALNKVSKAHSDLLLAYRDDFSKYPKKIPTQYLEDVMTAVPKLLGQKFVFSRVNTNVRADNLKQALDSLCKARVCHMIYATHGNGLPLAAEVNSKRFKVALVDVGLVSAALDLRLDQIELLHDINLINSGAIAEQVVNQLLRTTQPFYVEPRSFYWVREEKSANAEIDYFIQHAGKIIPVEVKSGATGSMKSLQLFMHLKQYQLAVRINSDVPHFVKVNAKTHDGKLLDYQLLSIPFYLIEQLPRLLDAYFGSVKTRLK